MHLSAHFTLEEFTRSETALRKGLDNTPDAETVANLIELANGMEKVRRLLDRPIHINSAYRGPKVNSSVGGSKNSAHMKGYAADFVCPGFGTPLEICKAIQGSGIEFDQLIHEFGSWTHISFDPQMRGQVLTIDSNGTRQGL
jgi:zinc D-Ala-D-Ala carboxypeptidase